MWASSESCSVTVTPELQKKMGGHELDLVKLKV